MAKTNRQFPLRITLTITVLLAMPAFFNFSNRLQELGFLAVSEKWQALNLLLSIIVGLICLLAISSWWDPTGAILLTGFDHTRGVLQRVGRWNLVAAVVALAGFTALMWSPAGSYLQDGMVQCFLLWGVTLLAGSLIHAGSRSRSWVFWVLFSWMGTAASLEAASLLSDITNFPFSINWSEGSQLFETSRLVSAVLYGENLPLPLYNPARMLLKVVPFLISANMAVWGHRLWETVLWMSLPLLTSLSVARRLKIEQVPEKIVMVFWFILFLFQGPVFYELLPCVLIILTGFRPQRFRQGLLWVAAASVWAGLTRVNWFPLPGALAALLYLLETPWTGSPLRYLWKPAAWFGAGISAALISKNIYVTLSGYPSYYYTHMFGADMLWYRLLPNATNPLGIIPAAILVLLPSLVFIGWSMAHFHPHLHPVRWWGLLFIPVIFLLGGLFVSVKIGGGNNLHNLDAALVLTALLILFLYRGDIPADPISVLPERNPQFLGILAFLVGLSPTLFLLPVPFNRISAEDVNQARSVVTELQNSLPAGNKPTVLFLHQPHLPAVRLIRNIMPADGYFDSILFDMAFTRNRAYLDRFYEDLRSHRFAAIVAGQLPTQVKGSQEYFGEENDAWAKYISRPVLCYYTQSEYWSVQSLQVLVPKMDNPDCPIDWQ